jgi:short chain dehydrogenase
MPHLTGKRVLIVGAETEIGRAVTTAAAEAGASVAAVAATSDAEAAFAVQRLARRLSSAERKVIAQAIDATNEAAVRVMVRQVSKELSGLDAVVSTASHQVPSEKTVRFLALIEKFAEKEMRKSDRGILIATLPLDQPSLPPPRGLPSGEITLRPSSVSTWLPLPRGAPWGREHRVLLVPTNNREESEIIAHVVGAIAGEPDSG